MRAAESCRECCLARFDARPLRRPGHARAGGPDGQSKGEEGKQGPEPAQTSFRRKSALDLTGDRQQSCIGNRGIRYARLIAEQGTMATLSSSFPATRGHDAKGKGKAGATAKGEAPLGPFGP